MVSNFQNELAISMDLSSGAGGTFFRRRLLGVGANGGDEFTAARGFGTNTARNQFNHGGSNDDFSQK